VHHAADEAAETQHLAREIEVGRCERVEDLVRVHANATVAILELSVAAVGLGVQLVCYRESEREG